MAVTEPCADGPFARRAAALRARSSALAHIVVATASLAAGVALLLNQDVVAGWFCLGLAGLSVLGLSFRR